MTTLDDFFIKSVVGEIEKAATDVFNNLISNQEEDISIKISDVVKPYIEQKALEELGPGYDVQVISTMSQTEPNIADVSWSVSADK